MTLDIEEKKLLYLYGCSNYRNTLKRLRWLTMMTVDGTEKSISLVLLHKLEKGIPESRYYAFYLYIRTQMNEYRKAQQCQRIVEADTNCCAKLC